MIHHGIKCLECGDEVYSVYRHDFRTCSCGAVFADGGFDYGRFGSTPGKRHKECSKVWLCSDCDEPLDETAAGVTMCDDCWEHEVTEMIES